MLVYVRCALPKEVGALLKALKMIERCHSGAVNGVNGRYILQKGTRQLACEATASFAMNFTLDKPEI